LSFIAKQKRLTTEAKASASFLEWKKSKEDELDRFAMKMKEQAKIKVSYSCDGILLGMWQFGWGKTVFSLYQENHHTEWGERCV